MGAWLRPTQPQRPHPRTLESPAHWRDVDAVANGCPGRGNSHPKINYRSAGAIVPAGPSECPRCDSNAHWTDFESAASADWATGAWPAGCRRPRAAYRVHHPTFTSVERPSATQPSVKWPNARSFQGTDVGRPR